MKLDALGKTLEIIREFGPITLADLQAKHTHSRNRIFHSLRIYLDGGFIEEIHPNVYEVTLKGARTYHTLRGKNDDGDQAVTDLTILLGFNVDSSRVYESLQAIPQLAERFLKVGFLYNELGKDAKNTEIRALTMQHRILMRELDHHVDNVSNILYLLKSMTDDTVGLDNLVRYFNYQEHKGLPVPPVHSFSPSD